MPNMRTGIASAILLIYLICGILGLINYILSSIAVHKIASRREIKNAWLAWIPYANNWIVGSIVDDYDETRKIKRKWRAVLLSLSLITLAVTIIAVIYAVVSIVVLSLEFGQSPYDTISNSQILQLVLSIYIPIILVTIISTIHSFCNAICIFKIFESTMPEKAVLFFILSLIIPLAQTICLFVCRNKGYEKEKPITQWLNNQQISQTLAETTKIDIDEQN